MLPAIMRKVCISLVTVMATAIVTIWAAIGATVATAQGAPDDARARAIEVIGRAITAPCAVEGIDPRKWGAHMGGAVMAEEKIGMMGRSPVRIMRDFDLPSGDRIRIVTVIPGGRLSRVVAEFHQALSGSTGPRSARRPIMMAMADGGCRIRMGRALTYDAKGNARWIVRLDGDLKDADAPQPLDAPVPPGVDPGGVAVALVDSGVNYTLPLIAKRLARSADGQLLGFDYWDMDDRPFDLDSSRSPFVPRRHGTRMASVLLGEAPAARLIPYRYPRPDMKRMADLVADADAKGARIVAMPMGSDKPDDWRAFEKAARAREHILFVVSAGNNGRDIDLTPVYPAALGLGNILVVTSSKKDGRFPRGSNWGARRVDLMVPAENLPATDYRGRAIRVSGSSFAVSRVAALAARLLAKNPDWRAAELKQAIIARTEPAKKLKIPRVRHGWIADPSKDG